MDIKDLKKKMFIASRFCNFYNDKDKTVLRGIPLSKGYSFNIKLPQEKIALYNNIYAKCNSAVSYIIILGLVLFLYLGIFPNYLVIIKLLPVLMLLIVVILPVFLSLGVLYLTGVFLERYIEKFIGSFKVVSFKPTIYNIDRDSYNNYTANSTPQKSAIQFAVMALILGVLMSPLLVLKMQMKSKNYEGIIKTANVYLAVNPLPARIYAMRAYAKYNNQDYKGSVEDYQKANDYSLSNVYDSDKYLAMTKFYDSKDMIAEFDKVIYSTEINAEKYSFIYAKANYQYRIKDYQSALKNYNTIVQAYKNDEKILIQPAELYLRRGKTHEKLGDSYAYRSDLNVAENHCPECNYKAYTEEQLIVTPVSY